MNARARSRRCSHIRYHPTAKDTARRIAPPPFLWAAATLLVLALLGAVVTGSKAFLPSPPNPSSPFLQTPGPAAGLAPAPSPGAKDDLVLVKDAVPGGIIFLPYATARNFTGHVLYPSHTAVLRRGTAQRLAQAQGLLQAQGYRLKVWDAYRPLSVQWEMWRVFPSPGFVGDPLGAGSRHNRGAAVDVTLADEAGREMVMPTGFDDFSSHAARSDPAMTPEARRNLAVLTVAMEAAGFLVYDQEWWHFSDPDWAGYEPLDVPLPPLRPR